MADYFTPTVIQPTIPAQDITHLERLLLSRIFSAQSDGEGLYFYAEESPADIVMQIPTKSPADSEMMSPGVPK